MELLVYRTIKTGMSYICRSQWHFDETKKHPVVTCQRSLDRVKAQTEWCPQDYNHLNRLSERLSLKVFENKNERLGQ